MHPHPRHLAALAAAAALAALISCARPTATVAPPPTVVAQTCDDSLWQHVYAGTFKSAKDRLKVITPCLAVTGTVFNFVSEPDGDFHIRLTPDSQFRNLLNAKNKSGQSNHLVLEPVCEHPPKQADTVKEGVCNGFSQSIFQPGMVGKHVQVVGAYVQDMEHGWREIHPVTSIQVIP